MTCIVGLAHKGSVYIGADSASVAGWEVRATRLCKAFKHGRFVIGYTDSFRMGQLLQHRLTVEPQGKEMNDEYMVNVFAEAVRQCLKDHGYAKIDNNQESGGTFLVGHRGHLYRFGGDFQVNESVDSYDAVGCGADYALGAMYTMDKSMGLRKYILAALQAADHFSGGVRGPFYVVKGGKK